MQNTKILGCVCKIKIVCHSEKRSDEESLLLPQVSLFKAEPRPFAIAQGDMNLICIQTLVSAAVRAGVKRIIHISITNPPADSLLPYFWGKAANEKAVIDSGMGYVTLRPTVLFGKEDILINNIAWLLGSFPIFGLPGSGSYKLSPVYVDDLANLAVEAVYKKENYIWDAVGPDQITFKEMVDMIGGSIGKKRLLISLPPSLALFAAQFMSLFVNDVMLIPEEVDGLMANLLISKEPPRCKTSLRKWLKENQETVGRNYASELARHF